MMNSMQSQSGISGCHERVCACVQRRLQKLTEDLTVLLSTVISSITSIFSIIFVYDT